MTINNSTWLQSSLEPRSSLPPLFVLLLVANMRGEGLGDFITCGNVRWTEGRHTRSDTQSIIHEWSVSNVLSNMSCINAVLWTFQSSVLGLSKEGLWESSLDIAFCVPMLHHHMWNDLPGFPPPYLHTYWGGHKGTSSSVFMMVSFPGLPLFRLL